MPQLHKNRRLLGAILLGLLLVAMLVGPWVFDVIHVPGEFSCTPPWVRVGGNFCGLPVPGIYTALGNIGLFFLLPLITSAAMLWRPGSRPLLIVHLLGLILVIAVLLYTGLLSYPRFSWAVWGVLLYLASAAGALLLEVLLLMEASTAR
jgi:hypothetical protein